MNILQGLDCNYTFFILINYGHTNESDSFDIITPLDGRSQTFAEARFFLILFTSEFHNVRFARPTHFVF